MQPNSQSQIRDREDQIRDQNPQNSLLRTDEVQQINLYLARIPWLIRSNQEEALLRDAESQRLMDSVTDPLRPTQYNFVNRIVDQVLNGANCFGYRNALAGYLASSVVSIIAVTAHCSELYKEASAKGVMNTAENIEKLNSYNRNRTEMRHNCIEEQLPFAVPVAIFLFTVTLIAAQQYATFRSRRVEQERAQEMPENSENQPQAQGDQPRQATVLGDIVVLVEPNPHSPRRD